MLVQYLSLYVHIRCQADEDGTPSTPKSTTKAIKNTTDAATPRTTAQLASQNIKKSKERAADASITRATTQSMKSRDVRREIVDNMKGHEKINKSAVCRGLNLSRTHLYYKSRRGAKPKTADATIKLVTDFYGREDVSTIYPNKTKNGKILRVLKDTVRKTYEMFISEFGPLMKSTTFHKLRPKEIKLRRRSQYLQCICDPCDNVESLLHSIRQSMCKEELESPHFLSDISLFAKACVCSFDNYDCLDKKCKKCRPELNLKPFLDTWLEREDGKKIKYDVWEYVTEEFKAKEVPKLRRVRKEGLRYELYQDLVRELQRTPSFSLHNKNAKDQLFSYKLCKSSLKEDEVAVCVDFAKKLCMPNEERGTLIVLQQGQHDCASHGSNVSSR